MTQRRISALALASSSVLLIFSHFTSSSISPKSRSRSACCSSSVGHNSVCSLGSSTICANRTARQAASGLRAHHRCNVLGCPWRIDFSRAAAALMASKGRVTSISFLQYVVIGHFSLRAYQVQIQNKNHYTLVGCCLHKPMKRKGANSNWHKI